MNFFLSALFILWFSLGSVPVLAEDVITVNTAHGGKQSFILLKADNPIAAVILFPGGDGYIKLSGGSLGRKKKSFLVHNRKDFADRGLVVALADAPNGMKELDRPYRMSKKHGQDIKAIGEYLKKQADVPVWIVGHSRGTFSAANGAIRAKGLIRGLILASPVTISLDSYSIFKTHPNGILDMALNEVAVPTLVISNKQDACKVSPAANADRLAMAFAGAPMKAVKVFDGKRETAKKPCSYSSQHQFAKSGGRLADAIASFIKANGG